MPQRSTQLKRHWAQTTGRAVARPAREGLRLHQLHQSFPDQLLVVILDNCSIHKSKKVKRFVAKTAWLELEHLTPYNPEYNPIEILALAQEKSVWWQILQDDGRDYLDHPQVALALQRRSTDHDDPIQFYGLCRIVIDLSERALRS